MLVMHSASSVIVAIGVAVAVAIFGVVSAMVCQCWC